MLTHTEPLSAGEYFEQAAASGKLHDNMAVAVRDGNGIPELWIEKENGQFLLVDHSRAVVIPAAAGMAEEVRERCRQEGIEVPPEFSG